MRHEEAITIPRQEAMRLAEGQDVFVNKVIEKNEQGEHISYQLSQPI